MKKLLKHLSKSTISILLAVLMVVSTFAVGMLTTAAAFVEQNGSVGAKVDSDSVGWNDNDGIHIKIGQADWKTYKADTSTGVTESFTIDSDDTSVQFGFRAWGKWYHKSSSQGNPGYNSTTATYTAQLEGSDYSMTLPAGTYRAELVNQSGNDLTYRFYRISAGSTTYYIVGDTALVTGGWDFKEPLNN